MYIIISAHVTTTILPSKLPIYGRLLQPDIRQYYCKIMAFVPIVICHCKSTKPKDHTSTLSLTYLLTCTTIPCAHKNKLCAWAADIFPPLDMAFLPTVL